MLKIFNNFKKEIQRHPFFYLVLGIVFFLGFLVRVYRVDKVLGFYFDQGRDALVIWDFIKKGKFFLIGPTTGLAGIFRGPYYYYLIAPFYFLGRGDPVWPAVFLAVTTVIAIFILYLLAVKIQDRVTGLIAVIIACFSFYIVMASRWLSNPTPMLILSMVLVWSMMKIAYTDKRKVAQKYWVIIAGVSGLSLFNFGSSGELFYFPALVIFSIWQRKKLPTLKYFLISLGVFVLTFLPLVLFDLKHEHILFNNFKQTFFEGSGSFKKVTKFIFEERTKFYYDVFTNKLFDARGRNEVFVLIVSALGFFGFLPKLIKNRGIRILILLLVSPLVGLYFYQGNYAILYDYYMTGYYLIFILLFAVVLGNLFKYPLGKIFVIYFFWLFLNANYQIVVNKVSDKLNSGESIGFLNQKQALDWIYEKTAGKEFNIDVYVPPVIPYAYDYLFKWYGASRYGYEPKLELVKDLYTLYETDSPHPERLSAWLDRQKGIGKVIETEKFGGITVEKRERL